MPRLLLIEDDVMVGSGIRLAFRQENFAVDWVQDRASAERAMQSQSYAAVLIDIEFPRHERLNSMDWLRTRAGQTGIVVVSAHLADDGSSSIDLEDLLAKVRAAVPGSGRAARGEEATIALPFTWS